MTGLVPDGLTMRCDSRDIVTRDSGFSDRGYRGISEPSAKVEIETRVFGWCCACQRASETLTLWRRVVANRERQKLSVDSRFALRRESHDRRGNAVERSAGHQSDDDG